MCKLAHLQNRLGELGIVPPEQDEALLDTMLQGARRYLLARIGQEMLPEDAEAIVVDIAAGEYLLWRQGKGDLDGFEAEYAIRQMSQGDTSITYAVANEGMNSTEMLIQRLLNPPEAVINRWRRIRW